jgi:hypothetical protein
MSDDYDQFSSDVLDESTLPAPREIGANVEIGNEVLTPWDAFESEPFRVGGNVEIGDEDVTEARATGYDAQYEIGANTEIGFDDEEGEFSPEGDYLPGRHEIGANIEIGGNTEIGAALAIRSVLMKARDNRQPAPPMKALDVDAPERDSEDDWALAETCIGAAAATGELDPFPLLSSLMQRCGTGMPPRIVRVDTQESYEAFRAAGSPEMAEFRERLVELERKLSAHTRDPYAHERIADEVDDLTWLGAEADKALAEKRVEVQLPPGFAGKHDAWVDEDDIWASLKIPHEDGDVWWLTSVEPLDKSIREASHHAADAGVSASTVVGAIPAIGEVLGAATAIKEMVAAVPSILKRPEAKGREPFVIRVEPKMSPALCALTLLAVECGKGNGQACEEWNRLSAVAPAQVRQAMAEASEIMKQGKKAA